MNLNLAVIGIFGLFVGSACGSDDIEFVERDTEYGTVRGIQYDGVNYFRGIRYAKPPVEELRFMPPEEPDDHDETVNATVFGPPCYQARFFGDLHSEEPYSEDCLFLNIWTPADATSSKQHVVIVYLHDGLNTNMDGAFFDDAAADIVRDHDIVFATFNYRLGPLGFLSVDGAKNAGFHDQILALKFLYNNMVEFGGHDECINLMGEGTAADAISTHMIIDESNEHFQGCIRIAGGWNTPFAFKPNERQTSLELAELLECPTDKGDDETLACLQGLDPVEITAAGATFVENGFDFPWGIDNTDEDLFTSSVQTLAENAPGKPCVVGLHQRESLLFTTAPINIGEHNFIAGEDYNVTDFEEFVDYIIEQKGWTYAEEIHSMFMAHYYYLREAETTDNHTRAVLAYTALADDWLFVAPFFDELFNKDYGWINKRGDWSDNQYVFLHSFYRDAHWPYDHVLNASTETNVIRDFFNQTYLHEFEADDSDMDVRAYVRTFLTNFAHYWNPSPSGPFWPFGSRVAPKKWYMTKNGNRRYMNIDTELKMHKKIKEGTNVLWMKLIPFVEKQNESKIAKKMKGVMKKVEKNAKKYPL